MSVCIFAGPTLSRDPRKRSSDFTFLPPAAQGDVYRAATRSPAAIGLIDGYFENVPAVWHKEILWTLDRGVTVFGAGSMGALRAAELWRFGMIGVGVIFEAYKDNRIEDDDEVAVLHGPAELDYPPLTEAMVNVRVTLSRAAAEGVVAADAGDAIARIAKATFYKERTWAKVLLSAERAGLSAGDLELLRDWLTRGMVDQKRDDAHLMLDAIAVFGGSGRQSSRPNFAFRNTRDWQRVVREHGS